MPYTGAVESSETVADIGSYVSGHITRINDITDRMQNVVDKLVFKLESFAEHLRHEVGESSSSMLLTSLNGHERSLCIPGHAEVQPIAKAADTEGVSTTTDGVVADTSDGTEKATTTHKKGQQWRYASVSERTAMATERANRLEKAQKRQQMLKQLSRLLDLMFVGALHTIAGSELDEFMSRLDIMKNGHVLFAVKVCFDHRYVGSTDEKDGCRVESIKESKMGMTSLVSRSSFGTLGSGHTAIGNALVPMTSKESVGREPANSEDVGYRLEPTVSHILEAMLSIPRTLRTSLLRVPYVSLTTSPGNSSNYSVFSRSEREAVRQGRRMFEEDVSKLLPLEDVERIVAAKFDDNYLVMSKRKLFVCVRNFYVSFAHLKDLQKACAQMCASREKRELRSREKSRQYRSHRLSDGYVSAIRLSDDLAPKDGDITSNKMDDGGSGDRVLMTEERVNAVLHLRTLCSVLGNIRGNVESCRLLEINACPLKELHLPRLLSLKQEIEKVLCDELIASCKTVNIQLQGYCQRFKTLLTSFVRQQTIKSGRQTSTVNQTAIDDGVEGSTDGSAIVISSDDGNAGHRAKSADSAAEQLTPDDEREDLDTIAELLGYIMLHRAGGNLHCEVDSGTECSCFYSRYKAVHDLADDSSTRE